MLTQEQARSLALPVIREPGFRYFDGSVFVDGAWRSTFKDCNYTDVLRVCVWGLPFNEMTGNGPIKLDENGKMIDKVFVGTFNDEEYRIVIKEI